MALIAIHTLRPATSYRIPTLSLIDSAADRLSIPTLFLKAQVKAMRVIPKLFESGHTTRSPTNGRPAREWGRSRPDYVPAQADRRRLGNEGRNDGRSFI